MPQAVESDITEASARSEDPGAGYRARLADAARDEARLRRFDGRFVALKLLLFLALVVAGMLAVHYRTTGWGWALLGLFVLLLIVFARHERVLLGLRRAERLRRYYEQAIARIEDRWAGTGQGGERFLDDAHLYARDLDLFGRGGLFELLNSTRTRAGEEILAAWLLQPATPDEALSRQAAVRDLAPRCGFREALAMAGEEMSGGARPLELAAWCEGPGTGPTWPGLMAAPVLGLAWVASIVVWAWTGQIDFAIGMSVLNASLSWSFGKKDRAMAGQVEDATHDLGMLAAVFACIEGEEFRSERLARRRGQLRGDRECASTAMRGLKHRSDWLLARHNIVIRLFEPFVFWTVICTALVERWRARWSNRVRTWLEAAGEIEALSAIGGYAWEHPASRYPEFSDSAPRFHAEELSHPLLPASRAVANDVRLDAEMPLIMLSGPNMAGKSTLLRAIGLNAVLAQAGAPVAARRLVLSPLAVATSISVSDSLQGGLSRFYAEIQRLKHIQDLTQGDARVLFLLDELLSGTNSHDRRVGTEAILRTLLSRGAAGMVTTHDLALTQIVDKLPGKALNYHFEDRYCEGKLLFDYRMVPGVVQTANALKLMRAVGLEVSDDEEARG